MKAIATFSRDSLNPLVRRVGALLGLILPGSHRVTHARQVPAPFDAGKRWVLLPILNHSGAPQAGERVESILDALLPDAGLAGVQLYPASDTIDSLPELNGRLLYERSLAWARGNGYALGISGSVDEWGYQNGVDGEPAVAVNVQVVEIASGNVLWNATGARSGWGRETLKGTAKKLLRDLLATMHVRQEN